MYEDIILIEGEVIDTYGGDYTWRDITYDVDEQGNYTFWERRYGTKPEDSFVVDDIDDIQYYISLINNI